MYIHTMYISNIHTCTCIHTYVHTYIHSSYIHIISNIHNYIHTYTWFPILYFSSSDETCDSHPQSTENIHESHDHDSPSKRSILCTTRSLLDSAQKYQPTGEGLNELVHSPGITKFNRNCTIRNPSLRKYYTASSSCSTDQSVRLPVRRSPRLAGISCEEIKISFLLI